MKLLIAILCVLPVVAMADYPAPERKQSQVQLFTRGLTQSPGLTVVTGSSSIRRWRSIHEDLAPTVVIPTGIPGSNMNDLDYYLHDLVLRYEPNVVVIYQGDNDSSLRGVSASDVDATFKHVVARIKKSLPKVFIYVMSVKRNVAAPHTRTKVFDINEKLAARADELDYLAYVDMTTPLLNDDGTPRRELFQKDGVHLNDEGYRIWTSILQPILAAHPWHWHTPGADLDQAVTLAP